MYDDLKTAAYNKKKVCFQRKLIQLNEWNDS